MPGDKSRDLQKVNRRSFVKTLSAIGVSSTTLDYLSQDALAQVTHDPTEEVPYVAFLRGNSPNRKPVYRTIERDEWERRYTAVDAAKRVSKKLEKLAPSHGAIATFTSIEQSPTGFGVKVKYYSKVSSDGRKQTPEISIAKLRQKLPDKISGKAGEGKYESKRKGIPVLVEEVKVSESTDTPATTNINQPYWGPQPGGIRIDTNGTSTSCAPFYSNQYGKGIICSGHAAEGEFVNPVEQSGEEIGNVEFININGDIDFAYIKSSLSQVRPVIPSVANHGVSEYVIEGILTDDALIANEGNRNFVLTTQGSNTGRIDHYISNIGYVEGDSAIVFVQTKGRNETVKKGDSGGPLYYRSPGGDEVYIAGVIVADKALPIDASSHTTAETIESGGVNESTFSGEFITPDRQGVEGYVFKQPLISDFSVPPTDTEELDAELYEDLNGNGDGLGVDQTVTVFGELVRGNDLGLTDDQARKLNWSDESPATEVTVPDMVSLFGEQIRADSNSLQTRYIRVNGTKIDLLNASDEELRNVMELMLKDGLTPEELGITK